MIFPHYQNWRTSDLDYSLALANSVNTGGSWNTSSGAIANSKWWATRGFQGHGPTVQYPGGAGMDGMGCGCGCGGGCGGHGGSSSTLLLIGALALIWFCSKGRYTGGLM